ncbi:PREDICTED: receptor-like protein 12 [Camelina sativa]|uniref:Receptor-like protein 12 n=1 Tax=Camelina sativa TaxID=90675 RepID=A0ABM1QR37_CAMSA|nr:PREDICTED: receptor-like protein 12 [Camelina sativa]
MAYNLMSHRILEPLSKLANLMRLDLSFQKTPYTFNFDFLLFKSLERLDLSGNSVSVVGTGSENLTHLHLSSCNITEFPMYIKDLQRLWWLDISNNRIKGKVPELLWNLPSMAYVNISHNSFDSLEGTPKVILNSSISDLDLSSNAFKGSFPIIPPYVHIMAASYNYFTGGIPLTFCKRYKLSLLDLSNNNFSGSIPRCLTNVSLGLQALKLSNNNLTGRLPDIEDRLVLLDVGHNQISGKLPRSLVNCTSLKFLNVEGNRIDDTFPFWLKALPRLELIVLRSNRFHGPISSPDEISLSFSALRIIDISRNSFNGSLPQNYFSNWSVPLVNTPQGYRWPQYTGDEHSKYETPLWSYPSIHLRIKGRSMELEKIPDTYTAIDFSRNSFEGQIPESIGFLKSLIVLDLSNNSFTGHIPSSLAKLKQLESLDLSQNRIAGSIPQELRDLTFLGYVNMSHNRLTGQIPQSTQIGGQPKSSFEGNINLCGLPLQERCFKGNGAPSTPQTQETELPKEENVLNWKAAAIGSGPGVLFGLAIGQALARYKPIIFAFITHIVTFNCQIHKA